MKTRFTIGGVSFICALVAGSAAADLILHDIRLKGRYAWERDIATEGLRETSRFDLNDLPDFATHVMDGPVDSAGNGIIPAGFLPENVALDSNQNENGEGGPNGRGVGGEGLLAVGPGSPGDVPANTILANVPTDGFDIILSPDHKGVYPTAVEWTQACYEGVGTAGISVYGPNDELLQYFTPMPAPRDGNGFGVIGYDGEQIGRITLHDVAGKGQEGIMGILVTYSMELFEAPLQSFEVSKGVLLEGDLADLQRSDQQYVQVRSGFGTTLVDAHHMELLVAAMTDVTDPQEFLAVVESKLIDESGTAQVRFRDWTTGDLVEVAEFAAGPDETVQTVKVSPVSNFVNETGDIEMSLKYIVFVPFFAFNFDTWFDFIHINVR